MGTYTEGNFLGENSTEQLVTELIRQIRYSKGFSIQTLPIATGRTTNLPGGDNNWVAYGTMLEVSEAIYLTNRTKFRFLVPMSMTGSESTVIPAIYRYSGVNEQTNLPECTLIAYGDSLNAEQGGWYEEAMNLTENNVLSTANIYYFVYIYDTRSSLSMLGSPGTHNEHTPYISFSTLLDTVTSAPETLEMTAEAVLHAYGCIYASGDTR